MPLKLGVKVVDEQIIDVQATEAQSQLLNMQKKNPDYAIIQETWGATATILRDAKTLGIETQFIGLNWASGEGVIDQLWVLKLQKDIWESFHTQCHHEDLPGMAEVKEYLDAEGKSIRRY